MTKRAEENRISGGGAKPVRWRTSSALILIATSALSIQNAILFLAFLIFLGGVPSLTFDIARVSFFMDYPATVLLGIGLVSLSLSLRRPQMNNASESDGPMQRGLRLLTLAGSFCIVSALLTLSWRWAIPSFIGRDFQDILFRILESEGGLPGELPSYETPIRAMFYLWMAASATLVAAAYLLRFSSKGLRGAVLVEEKVDLRSWEGFATLNAVGTFLVAFEMLRIIDGRVGGPLLLAGIFMKVTFVPLNGAFAYSYLARRAARLRHEMRGPAEIVDVASGSQKGEDEKQDGDPSAPRIASPGSDPQAKGREETSRDEEGSTEQQG